jgi:hypothetical protein
VVFLFSYLHLLNPKLVSFMLHILLRTNLGPVFVIGIIAFIGGIIFLGVYFNKTARIKRKLRKSPVRSMLEVQEGEVVKVAGKITMVGRPLTAPLSGRQCSYYHIKVEQYKRQGRSSHWATIIEEEVKGDVVLKDGSSYALIDTTKVLSHLVPDKKFAAGFMNDAQGHLQAYLKKHGVDSQNWLGLNKALRFNEGVLEPGETVAALGKATWKRKGQITQDVPSERILVIGSTDDNQPVYISDEPSVIS